MRFRTFRFALSLTAANDVLASLRAGGVVGAAALVP